ncbi:MAG: AEC family transporter [Aristaeellaceae bacterium]
MQEFIVTLNIMLPLLVMLGLGWFLRRIGMMGEAVTQGMNKLVFKLFLPLTLFNNIRALDMNNVPGLAFAAYLFLGVLGVFLLARLIVPRLVKNPRQSGVVVQTLFRTNFAILGVPLMQSIFGQAGLATATLGLPVVIPLNNVLAVLALVPCGGKADARTVIRRIITNPLIIGVALGGVCLLCGLVLPGPIEKVCTDLGSLATPVSLLVLGASLRWQGVKNSRRVLGWTLVFKQLVIPLAMMGLAIALGFRGMELGVIVILFGAPTAVSSFPMAQAMGGDGPLAANLVALTTVCSMGTLFLMIFLCKLAAFF